MPGICFQLVFLDDGNAVNEEQVVLVAQLAEPWMLAATQLSAQLRKPLVSLSSIFPMKLKSVNFMWAQVVDRCVHLDLVRLQANAGVVLAPLGRLVLFLPLPFSLACFLVVALCLRPRLEMWKCAVHRVLYRT